MMQRVFWVHKGVLGSGANQTHTLLLFLAENQGQNACGAKTPQNNGKLGELIFFRIRRGSFKLF